MPRAEQAARGGRLGSLGRAELVLCAGGDVDALSGCISRALDGSLNARMAGDPGEQAFGRALGSGDEPFGRCREACKLTTQRRAAGERLVYDPVLLLPAGYLGVIRLIVDDGLRDLLARRQPRHGPARVWVDRRAVRRQGSREVVCSRPVDVPALASRALARKRSLSDGIPCVQLWGRSSSNSPVPGAG